MNILLVNPNTSAEMTDKIAQSANAIASEGTKVIARHSLQGPASIEGYYDGALSVPGMLAAIKSSPPYDAIIIACFDDTGLNAVRCLTDKPVIGIGEAAYHMASLISNKFSVVTTLARSVPLLEQNVSLYGLSKKCINVRASEVEVLALEKHNPQAVAKISLEIEQAIAIDNAEAIVLGCAGMTDLATKLQKKYNLPVLDGVSCAVSLAESLIKLGLKTSKLGGYAQAVEK